MTRISSFFSLSLLCIYLPLLWGLSATEAQGQLTNADREKLLQGIQSATVDLDPSRLPNLELVTATLLERVQELEKWLSRAADSENREAWLRYLRLDPLTDAIKSGASASEQMKEAIAIRNRMIGTAPGLEMTAVRGLRDAVDSLIDAILFRNSDQSMAMLTSQLQSLAEMIGQADDCPSPDQFNAISTRVALLESSGQAHELVRQFRNTFNRPNAAIMIGSTLVSQAIARPVFRERPVSDCILGTRLVGTALLEGNVNAKLLPSIGAARVCLFFDGTVSTANTGYNGPVRLRTVGNGHVTANRTMSVDALGIEFGETSSEAALSTRITRIEHKLALVRAIARKQAAKQKPAADRIALQRLRIQIGDQFSSETAEVSPVTPTELLARAEPMLKRLSLTKPTQFWSSTEDAISIDSVFRGPEQLSSIVTRPDVSPPFAVAVQIHESAIENAFGVMLAGRTLNEQRLNELLEKVGRKETTAENGEEDASEPPFEISFSRSRPVIFEARSESLRVGLRGTRFVQGDRAPLNKAMEITAIYHPATTDDGKIVLRRAGEVGVDFPRERLTLGEVGLKPLIQRAFSEIFPEQLLDQDLRISQDAKIQTLRGREFRPTQFQILDGWMTIAFE